MAVIPGLTFYRAERLARIAAFDAPTTPML